MLEAARTREASIHLFDEPNGAEWMTPLFFGTALDLRARGKVVVVAMHPRNPRELALLRGLCDRFVYAERGAFRLFDTFDGLAAHSSAQAYLAPLGD